MSSAAVTALAIIGGITVAIAAIPVLLVALASLPALPKARRRRMCERRLASELDPCPACGSADVSARIRVEKGKGSCASATCNACGHSHQTQRFASSYYAQERLKVEWEGGLSDGMQEQP